MEEDKIRVACNHLQKSASMSTKLGDDMAEEETADEL